jgi:hypothetical protein
MHQCGSRLSDLSATPTQCVTGCAASQKYTADPSRGQKISQDCVWHSKCTTHAGRNAAGPRPATRAGVHLFIDSQRLRSAVALLDSCKDQEAAWPVFTSPTSISTASRNVATVRGSMTRWPGTVAASSGWCDQTPL